MPLARVSRLSSVRLGLPTLTICSTFTWANCWMSGTALTSCSPRIVPPLYSARLVEEAPAPAIVPPVESTQTSGRFLASWHKPVVTPARPSTSAAAKLDNSLRIIRSSLDFAARPMLFRFESGKSDDLLPHLALLGGEGGCGLRRAGEDAPAGRKEARLQRGVA